MSWFNNLISHIEGIFTSAKAKKALEVVASIAPIAAVVVQDINALAPNKTLTEVQAAYEHFGVPFLATAVSADPNNGVGNALLNLATDVLKKKLPPEKATVATHMLNTAVQLAVTASKAQ